MTRIKLCGLSRIADIEAVNELMPEYVGFVFAPKSKRYVSPAHAEKLRSILRPEISAVGVFVDEKPENIYALTSAGIIDIVQLHGQEDDKYITHIRKLTGKIIIKAFTSGHIDEAEHSTADYILLDSGAGSGAVFDWAGVKGIKRSYFLAGGLTADNVRRAIDELSPFAVDVSSGIETDGMKDREKMSAFVSAVRRENIS